MLLIEDTIRGLSKGAPVEFRGVRIGTVTSVPWNFTAPQPDNRDRLAIPVLIRIEPQRLGIDDQDLDLDEWRERFDRLFDLGLRASLKNGSLLTGALFVDLTFDDQRAGEYEPETFVERTVFPTTSSGLAQIQSQVTALLDKLNALEVAPVLTGLENNLTTSQAMLEEVRDLTTSMQSLLDDPGTRELPGNLNATLQELQTTLEGLSADSPAYRELTDTLDQVERLMRDLQPAARKISEDPRPCCSTASTPRTRCPAPPTQGVSMMPSRGLTALLAASLAALWLSGCATGGTPPTHYTLPDAPIADATPDVSADRLLVIRPIRLARYLDVEASSSNSTTSPSSRPRGISGPSHWAASSSVACAIAWPLACPAHGSCSTATPPGAIPPWPCGSRWTASRADMTAWPWPKGAGNCAMPTANCCP